MGHHATDMRMTRQRRVIIEELRKMHTHPTADELFQSVRLSMPGISLATVYRNLKLLAQAGIITEMQTSGTQRRYEGAVEDHYHLMCVSCGRVDDAPVPPDQDLQEAVNRATGYEILSHHVEFMGLCPSCKQAGQNHYGARLSGQADKISDKKTHK